MHLNKKTIKELGADAAAGIYWDDALSGFGLRVFKSGKRSFVFRYRLGDGTSRQITIGSGRMDPADARNAALIQAGRVANGKDPVHERKIARLDAKENKAERAKRFKFRDLAQAWCDRDGEGSWMRTRARREEHRIVYKNVLPNLPDKWADDVTADDIEKMRVALDKKTRTSGVAVETVQRIYYWAIKTEVFAGGNPAKGVERTKSRPRESYLTPEEAETLFESIDAAEKRCLENGWRTRAAACDALRIQMLTGARRNEILGLRWEHLTDDYATASLTEHKTSEQGQPTVRVIHFSPTARQVLAKRRRATNSFWVFPGKTEAKHMSTSNHHLVWQMLLDVARERGLRRQLRPHDLRHSYASLLLRRGVGIEKIGAMLGHRDINTTMRYTHAHHDELQEIAADADEAITGKK